MKIKDIINAIWYEAWVKIGREDDYGGEYETEWEGYAGDLPDKYLERKFECLVPMIDYGPAIGIQLQ